MVNVCNLETDYTHSNVSQCFFLFQSKQTNKQTNKQTSMSKAGYSSCSGFLPVQMWQKSDLLSLTLCAITARFWTIHVITFVHLLKKVHYRIHNNPPLVPVPSHISPVYNTPLYSRYILILSFYLSGALPRTFLSGFPIKILQTSLFAIMSPPASRSWSHYPNNARQTATCLSKASPCAVP
jgi:hypothetical protein